MDTPIPVELKPSDGLWAGLVALMRNVKPIHNGGQNQHGMDDHDRWLYMLEGTYGELAFARAYGFHWHAGVGTHSHDPQGDVAGYEVKTHLGLGYLLRLRPVEAQRPKWYALVLGEYPKFYVYGCFYGPWALDHPEWLNDCGHPEREPSYLVPREQLVNVTGPAGGLSPEREEAEKEQGPAGSKEAAGP